MKFRVRGRSRGNYSGVPVILLGGYALGLGVYGALLWFSAVPDTLPAFESLKGSAYGVWAWGFSLGYVSIVLIAILAGLSVLGFRRGARLTTAGAGAMLILGLVVGASFGAVSAAMVPGPWPYSVQDSQQGFTLTVYYNSTVLNLGTNLTMKYTLTDNSYSLTTPYYLFGGQFSMVFYNSSNAQVVAFRAPVSFKPTLSTDLVQLAPGDTWTTLLGWNGTIFSANGTRRIAPTGDYNLASYVALQDANMTPSLYVVLHPSNLTVTIR
ncbi:MAG: hypothetical protein JRM74_05105 [Nitrososphaerota archaeon]|nr:hypothetical protein [Nitrososphaerota archaeon]